MTSDIRRGGPDTTAAIGDGKGYRVRQTKWDRDGAIDMALGGNASKVDGTSIGD